MPAPRIPASLRPARPALALIAVAAAAAGSLAPAEAPAAAVTRVSGHALLAPSGNLGGAVASGPARRRAALVQGLVQPGMTIGRVRVGLETRSAGGGADARGTVSARDLVLLDGRVAVASLDMTVSASSAPGAEVAGITGHRITGLRVDGVAVATEAGARVPVPGAGTLVIFEQSAAGTGVRANALRFEPSGAGATHGAGAAVVIGHIDATAGAPGEREGAATPGPPPRAGVDDPEAPALAPSPRAGGDDPGPPALAPSPRAGADDPGPPALARPPAPAAPAPPPPAVRPLPRRAAPAIAPRGPGYVFPVFGEAGFTDDYGAPRPGTGTHHGNDVFAATGTPVLAVADGTLSLVGVNPLGGNRLWLTDDRGNRFYYAHLSAYAPAALEGARVSAGQVIGFVGNTGQAITTPPHLHFEIHPAGGEAINPYPFLLAWRQAEAAPVAGAAAEAPPGSAAGGAVVVGVTPERDVAPVGGDEAAVPVT